MKMTPKDYFDYEKNPVLFLLWSWSLWGEQIIGSFQDAKKSRQEK